MPRRVASVRQLLLEQVEVGVLADHVEGRDQVGELAVGRWSSASTHRCRSCTSPSEPRRREPSLILESTFARSDVLMASRALPSSTSLVMVSFLSCSTWAAHGRRLGLVLEQ